jgi:hypothetical protein
MLQLAEQQVPCPALRDRAAGGLQRVGVGRGIDPALPPGQPRPGAARLPGTSGATAIRALPYPRRGTPETPEAPTGRRDGSVQQALCLGSARHSAMKFWRENEEADNNLLHGHARPPSTVRLGADLHE